MKIINMFNELNKKKKIVIISIVCLVILLVIGGTYAFFGWRSDVALLDITVSSGTGSCLGISDNTKAFEPVSSKENGRIIKLSANQQMGSKGLVTWTMTINQINGLQDQSFRYEMINNTTNASYGSGHFANINNVEGTNTITFSNNSDKLDFDQDYEFTLYLWIDGVSFTNPLTMAGQNLGFDISCSITGTDAGTTDNSNTLISHITNLYLNNKDEQLVERDGISYRYASSASLMNDRQASMEVGEDEGNIRYYGATPNNYIYFNCETYPDTNCELWRIIGIVDGKVKIARDSVLSSTMSWNSADTNNWENASLKTYLNGEYYESFRTKNVDTLNLISNSTWYLGGYSTSNGLYANDIYIYERTNSTDTIYSGNPPSIEANIGLMYASDYGYATDLSICDKDIYNYETSSNCKDKDWLSKSNETDTVHQWLINPNSSLSYGAWYVASSGFVTHGNNLVSRSRSVRAVLYLNSELAMESEHEGTSTDPYRISLS